MTGRALSALRVCRRPEWEAIVRAVLERGRGVGAALELGVGVRTVASLA